MNLKPQIKVAKHAVFCFGVKRAMDIAEETLKKEGSVYCCGPLIHNPQAVKKLEEQGMKVVSGPEEIPEGSTMIIRSHGAPIKVINLANRKNIKIIDATCPFVLRAQLVAKKFHENKFKVVICGDPKHAEVIAINSRIDNSGIIIDDPKKIKNLNNEKIGVLCQTTQKIGLLKKVVNKLLSKSNSISIENTICLDSSKRQKEIKKLGREVDLMIVVGGKNSSNTTKLVQLSQAAGAKTYHIETASEIEKDWFEGVGKIGIAAGASTPQFLIDETIEKLDLLFKIAN